MKYLLVLAAAAFLVPSCSYAVDYSAGDGQSKVTLTDKPCKLGDWFKDWREARWFYQGKVYAACWRLHRATVVTIDEAGDIGTIPMQQFKPEHGV